MTRPTTPANMSQLKRVRTWVSTTTWGSTRRQQGVAAGIAALVIAPQSSVDAGLGIDPSWEAVVAMAPGSGLEWGPELVFTYGPLGYLQTTAYYTWAQSALATVYQLSVVAALFLGIAAVLRQRCAPMVSLLGAFLATGLAALLQLGHGTSAGMMYPELAVLAALAWLAVPTLQAQPHRATVFVTCVLSGGAAGLQLLVKFNTGLTIVAIALLASILLGWKGLGRHTATVAAFVVSTVVCWVLVGQPVGNLPAWFRYSMAIVVGYNQAQAQPLTATAFPAVLLALGWIGVLALLLVRDGSRASRSVLLLVGALSVITVKSAFGRFDVWHFGMLLGVIVVGVALVPNFAMRLRAAILAAVLLVFCSVAGPFALVDRSLAAIRAPGQSVERLVTLAWPGRLQARVDETKARQRHIDAVPQSFVDAIGSKTVHVDPDETSVVWAYNFAWRPAPVFATYSSYTPSLDRLNGNALVDGPDFVLSRMSTTSPAQGIDGRLAVQESPLYSRALLCNYTLTGVENRWALFARTHPRCGQLTPLSTMDVTGKSLAIPAPTQPDRAVLVGIDLAPTVLDRLLQGVLAPVTSYTVVLDGVSYRLIVANAAEPFLVSDPASVSGSNLAIHAHTLAVGRTVSLGQADVRAQVRFYEMSVRP